ncbi:MAG: type IV pilin-like G/H family protein [Cyanobacteriota bacterium]|nr:type IV pilin-like G/H family protein [Cyanobacteriota bacterium]
MKTEFKAKFLQHVAKKKKEEGFTLIELLVVIIIIGILSAIALPSFLNQANKAKQSEAKQYLASINKGQQAFYVERNKFIGDIAEIGDLGLGIKTETSNYTYALNSADTSLQAAAWTDQGGVALAGYVGIVFIDADKTSQSILCEGTGGPLTYTPNVAHTTCVATGDFTTAL